MFELVGLKMEFITINIIFQLIEKIYDGLWKLKIRVGK